MPADSAALDALVDIITSSVKEAVEAYKAYSTDVPPINTPEPGPFDSHENVSTKLNKAVKLLEGACAQLCATIAPAGHTMVNKAYSYEESASISVALNAKITDILLNEPKGLHISELSKRSGVDALQLSRIMRLLATKHVYQEVEKDVYVNNRLSLKLHSTDPVGGIVGLVADDSLRAASYLWETLENTADHPPEKSPFQVAYGCHRFEYSSAHPKGKTALDRFALGMIGFALVTGKKLTLTSYPWGSLPDGTVVVDVGGSTGHVALDLLKTFPNLKGIVQDMEVVRPKWQEFWEKEYPEALESKRIDFVPFDFFKEAAVPGGDIYYIRHVLHDWSAADSLTILKHVRAALKPTARVIIHEFVLQSTARSAVLDTDIDVAPEPLLPNYGVGNIRPYNQDIHMLNNYNAAKERTLDEFIDLGTKAGLKFIRVWDAGETSLVEFEPV